MNEPKTYYIAEYYVVSKKDDSVHNIKEHKITTAKNDRDAFRLARIYAKEVLEGGLEITARLESIIRIDEKEIFHRPIKP